MSPLVEHTEEKAGRVEAREPAELDEVLANSSIPIRCDSPLNLVNVASVELLVNSTDRFFIISD